MELHIVLLNPEIPQNTGNIARTCAALGATLHLVEPLGFSLEDRYLKRAGLDYWHLVEVATHPTLEHALESAGNVYCLSTRGTHAYSEISYPDPCWLLFGPESKGLPERVLDAHPERVVRLPMREGARSLNLSNAVAVTAYEVFRQHEFQGLHTRRTPARTGGNT